MLANPISMKMLTKKVSFKAFGFEVNNAFSSVSIDNGRANAIKAEKAAKTPKAPLLNSPASMGRLNKKSIWGIALPLSSFPISLKSREGSLIKVF